MMFRCLVFNFNQFNFCLIVDVSSQTVRLSDHRRQGNHTILEFCSSSLLRWNDWQSLADSLLTEVISWMQLHRYDKWYNDLSDLNGRYLRKDIILYFLYSTSLKPSPFCFFSVGNQTLRAFYSMHTRLHYFYIIPRDSQFLVVDHRV